MNRGIDERGEEVVKTNTCMTAYMERCYQRHASLYIDGNSERQQWKTEKRGRKLYPADKTY